MDDNERRQLEKTLKRLRQTKRHEGICLMGWQAEQLVKYINELERRTKQNEQTDNHR